ncbi:WXG100 family type VII secretion target [Catenulispora rubra]|uniref:WXG100 family type VII secretion target n=1 Tax=Catenulispora rubra TaxID=280293 RepID=UPI0018924A38|nr:WXG100 family type VII secretion target [Catenulispora rubra]
MTTSPTSDGVTDFNQYTLPQLSQMLFESDPASGTTQAQTWDATGKMLHEQASNLEGRLRHFDGEWTGTASDEYKRMVNDLVTGLRKVADTSLQMRDLTFDAVDSLTAARAAMPAPVDVPVVPPTTLALATTPLPIDATTSPAAAAQMQADQARAVSAVQAQQAAVSASSAAHAQAVAVMRTLADSYVVAQNRFPPTPGGATPSVNGTGPGNGLGPDSPPVLLNGNGVPILLTDTKTGTQNQIPGQPTAPGQQNQGSQSLFGDMFTVGLAAAAAAAGGKFATSGTVGQNWMLSGQNNNQLNTGNTPITGRLTPVANPNGSKDDASKHAAVDTAGVLGSRYLAGKFGGAGAGGGGIGGIGPIKGISANPSAASAAADAARNLTATEAQVANTFGGGVLGAGGAAAAAASRGGMMPMMPMSGMAGGGGDANRRIPAWLVETEDVWGASAPVSPGVIGGDL